MFNVWGKDYADRAAVEARIADLNAQNAAWGESDDRVTELNALTAALGTDDVYTVVRDDFESPCDHPLCPILHKRFFEGTEVGFETVTLANGNTRVVRTVGSHMKTNRQWVILRNGQRVGDAHDTKRAALAEAAQRPRY